MKGLALLVTLLCAGCSVTSQLSEAGKERYAYCGDRYPGDSNGRFYCWERQSDGVDQQARFAARHGLTDESLPAQIASGDPAALAWRDCGEQWGRDDEMVGYCLMQADNHL